MRPRARAQRHRLAHVQRPPALVAEDVDAGVVRQSREVRALVARDRLAGLGLASAPARAQQVEGVAQRDGVGAQLREQRAEHARAREGVGKGAVHLVHLDPERAGERGESALARQRARSGARAAPCRARAASASRARHARTPGAARARRSGRCGRSARAPRAASASSASTSSGGGAPSTIPCVIPVKRWIPRESGRSTCTSESKVSCSSPPPTRTAADLGHLAEVAAVPVGLGVERHELRGREGLIELGHEHVIEPRAADGWGEFVHRRP